MNTLFFDSSHSDDIRRRHLYNGQVSVFSPRPSTVALCDFARQLSEEAFSPFDPRDAQHHIPAEEFAAILAKLKPKFIHHPKSKDLVRGMLEDFGCDLGRTYFDVPRMRTMAHGGYLSSGIAYALHPHRDTWYASPLCQLNWWLPIYDIESESAMAFHPRYWGQPVPNTSSTYDHYEWNRDARRSAAKHIKSDTRTQPRLEKEIDLEPQVRIVCPAGGLILFSGAQFHSTVPNTSGRTRFSIDFRTAHIDDLAARQGAPNVDSAPKGTTLRELLRGADLSRLPAEILALYEDHPAGGLAFDEDLQVWYRPEPITHS